MAITAPERAISHQNVRLGPGRHPRPGNVVCVMELASMLADERFGDRPVSVCPVIGAILRAYNDNVDDRRRQDLYRFAADAVDTRRDYRVQRRRADAALDWAVARYGQRGGTLLAPPDPEGPRDEIGYYVVGGLGRRRDWSDDEHRAVIALLDQLIEIDRKIDREPEPEPELGASLVGDLLEQITQTVEHRSGHHEFVLAEALQGGAEARLEASAPLLDQGEPTVGERGEHDPPVPVGALAVDQPGRGEALEHLGDAGRTEVGGLGEVAHGHLIAVAEAEEQAVLRVGEPARVARLTPAQPTHRRHRALERSSHVIGGVALLALTYHLARRR